MALGDVLLLSVSFVPAGFLLGCIPMLAGLGIQVAINIFRKV